MRQARLRRIGWGIAVVLGLGSIAAAACSGSGTHSEAAGGAGGAGTTAGTAQGGSTASFVGSGGANGSGGLMQCAGETHEGKVTPADVVIMLDHSSSMTYKVGTQSIWQLVTGAITNFVQASGSAGMGVGLQYFPIPAGPCTSCSGCTDLLVTDPTTNVCCCESPTGDTCTGMDGDACTTEGICYQGQCYSGGNNATCTPSDYASLDVPIDLLPTNAGPVVTSLGNHMPDGMTPTGPAVQGAIDAATARAKMYPDHAVAIVLATDGVPSECSPQDISSISAMVSAAAAATPPILTFVIGIGDTSALEAIAVAGGTKKAYLVSQSSTAGQQFLDALDAIHGSLLACSFDIPPPQTGPVDYGLVNVELTPAGQSPMLIPNVMDAAACTSDGGWYYDNPAAPTKIVLCDATCQQVKSLTDAKLDIVLGCATVVK